MKALNTHFTTAVKRQFSTAAVEPKVLFKEHTPSVFEFVLNSPKTLNAVDIEMCNMMADKLKQWHQAPESAPRVALMSGAGGKSFCAGGDIVKIYHAHQEGKPAKDLLEFFRQEYLLDYSLSQMKHVE